MFVFSERSLCSNRHVSPSSSDTLLYQNTSFKGSEINKQHSGLNQRRLSGPTGARALTPRHRTRSREVFTVNDEHPESITEGINELSISLLSVISASCWSAAS